MACLILQVSDFQSALTAHSKKHILHCYLGYTEEKFYEIPLLRTSLVV